MLKEIGFLQAQISEYHSLLLSGDVGLNLILGPEFSIQDSDKIKIIFLSQTTVELDTSILMLEKVIDGDKCSVIILLNGQAGIIMQ